MRNSIVLLAVQFLLLACGSSASNTPVNKGVNLNLHGTNYDFSFTEALTYTITKLSDNSTVSGTYTYQPDSATKFFLMHTSNEIEGFTCSYSTSDPDPVSLLCSSSHSQYMGDYEVH